MATLQLGGGMGRKKGTQATYKVSLYSYLTPETESQFLTKIEKITESKASPIKEKRTVYGPSRGGSKVFGTLMAVEDIERNEKYLEIAGKELLYHKHVCLIRNVDKVPMDGNSHALLCFLGREKKFDYFLNGKTFHFEDSETSAYIAVYEISKFRDLKQQIIEFYSLAKSEEVGEIEKKLMAFILRNFASLKCFKVQASMVRS